MIARKKLPLFIQNWLEAVEAADPAGITALYHKDARLKGTVWDVEVGHEPDPGAREDDTILGYFTGFVHRKFQATAVFYSIKETGKGYEGRYEFVWEDENGVAHHLPARFVFAEKEGLIVLHESWRKDGVENPAR